MPSQAESDKPTSGKPSRRVYYALKSRNPDPYHFKVDPNIEQSDFFSSKSLYLAVSLNGGHVNFFEIKESDLTFTPEYYEVFHNAYTINETLMSQIEGWLHFAYAAVKKFNPVERTLDSDIRVLGEYQRQFLVNQDTTNVATQIEQIVFNHQSYNKVMNMVGKLLLEIRAKQDKAVVRYDMIFSSLTMA